jgi:hypothetical protein
MPTSASFDFRIMGLTHDDLPSLRQALDGVDLNVTPVQSSTRSTDPLLIASFALAALRLTPAIINSLTECLSKLFASRYITFKITTSNDNLVEGAATPQHLREATKLLQALTPPKKQ